MWSVRDENITPQSYSAVYFLYLPVSGKCLYSDDIQNWANPSTLYGDVSFLASSNPNCPLIPVDPHLALSLGWIEIDEMVSEMSYVNDTLKACLRLVKDVKEQAKEQASGNDKK